VSFVYLAALLVSITGMVVLDRRFRLFFWADTRRAAVVLGAGVVLFLVWDLLGIGLGIFFRGQTPFMTGVLVAPEVPVEEIFFLVLLCYLSMNVFGAASRLGRPAGERAVLPPVPGPVEGHHVEKRASHEDAAAGPEEVR
jgi:lycopene cyclase domain-containing protein